MGKKLEVDLSRLWCLKSLVVSGPLLNELVLRGLAKGLIFLSLDSAWDNFVPFPLPWGLHKHWEKRSNTLQLIQQIGGLKELQYLVLGGFEGGELPNMRSMVSMSKAIFKHCENMVEVSGLSSKLSNLRVLNFQGCWTLRSCRGVSDLVNVEELILEGCESLERLPNLRKLRSMRKLDISGCPLINEVPGLGELVALEEIYARKTWPLDDIVPFSLKLPDMRKLRNLRVLCLCEWRLEAVPGFDCLISLQEVKADFGEVADRPSLQQLTKLQKLEINGWGSEGLGDLANLVMLHSLKISGCRGVDELPDFPSLSILQRLSIWDCDFKDVSSLSKLSALEELYISQCIMLERVPDLQRLTRLESLLILFCDAVRGSDCTWGPVEGSSRRSDDSRVESNLPSSQRFTNLHSLTLYDCEHLVDVRSVGAFLQLESLDYFLLLVKELPDLSNFRRLKLLCLSYCKSLGRMTSREPIHALSEIRLDHCTSLTTLPNLCSFTGLVKLDIRKCEGITVLNSSGPLTALEHIWIHDGCTNLEALPDLAMFPALEKLSLNECSGLTTLSSCAPLLDLKELDVRGCRSLSQDDLDHLRASCPECEIKCCSHTAGSLKNNSKKRKRKM